MVHYVHTETAMHIQYRSVNILARMRSLSLSFSHTNINSHTHSAYQLPANIFTVQPCAEIHYCHCGISHQVCEPQTHLKVAIYYHMPYTAQGASKLWCIFCLIEIKYSMSVSCLCWVQYGRYLCETCSLAWHKEERQHEIKTNSFQPL